MLPGINDLYLKMKEDQANHRFIVESVVSTDETIPGSDEEFEDIVDADSVPDDVYAAIDKALDKFVDDPDYDDTEAEELVDDDDEMFLGDIGVSDGAIEAIMDEAVDIMDAMTGGDSRMAKSEHVADFGGLDDLMNENYSQFTNGKFHMKGGQAYKPITNNPYVTDEARIEEEALRESASMGNLDEWAAENVVDEPTIYGVIAEGVKDKLNAAGDAIKRGVYHATPTVGGGAIGAALGGAAGAAAGYMSKDARKLRKHAKQMREDPDADEDSIRDANEIAKTVSKRNALKYAKAGAIAGGSLGATHGLAYTAGRGRGYKKGYEEGDRKGYADGVEDGKAGVVESSIYAAIAEGISNPDMEDFPNSTGSGNDHGARMNGFESHEAPDDFPSRTGGKTIDSGDEPTNRYRAVAEANTTVPDGYKEQSVPMAATSGLYGAGIYARDRAIAGGAIGYAAGHFGKEARAARKYAKEISKNPKASKKAIAKAEADAKAISRESRIKGLKRGAKYGAMAGAVEGGITGVVRGYKYGKNLYMNKEGDTKDYNKDYNEAVTNTDVEDFPGSEGTHTAEGRSYAPGMSHTDASKIYGYGDSSDYEQREVDTEDGGRDAIDVTKANESTYMYRGIAEAYADSASTAGGTRICEPGVECPGDFPRALPRETKGQAAGWGDESDTERREVGVEDGGESVIDVIKANESAKYRLW